jgi:hypothetical protein
MQKTNIKFKKYPPLLEGTQTNPPNAGPSKHRDAEVDVARAVFVEVS